MTREVLHPHIVLHSVLAYRVTHSVMLRLLWQIALHTAGCCVFFGRSRYTRRDAASFLADRVTHSVMLRLLWQIVLHTAGCCVFFGRSRYTQRDAASSLKLPLRCCHGSRLRCGTLG